MWGNGLDRSGLGQGQVAGACECGNEPSGSIKWGEFLDQLKTGQLLEKDCAAWNKEVSRYKLRDAISWGSDSGVAGYSAIFGNMTLNQWVVAWRQRLHRLDPLGYRDLVLSKRRRLIAQ